MHLTKKQKIYGGLLIVAAGAMFVDRVMIGSEMGTPQRATAKPARSLSVSGDGGIVPSDDAMSNIPDRDQLIASRLAVAARQRGIRIASLRDAFEPPESWVGRSNGVDTVNHSAMTAETFRRQYPLMAVIKTGGDSYAVVGNRTIRVGQILNGFTLVAVKQRTALFRSKLDQIELNLSSSQ